MQSWWFHDWGHSEVRLFLKGFLPPCCRTLSSGPVLPSPTAAAAPSPGHLFRTTSPETTLSSRAGPVLSDGTHPLSLAGAPWMSISILVVVGEWGSPPAVGPCKPQI